MSNRTAAVAITGLDELDASLKALEGKAAKKIVRASLRVGAKEIQREAKRRAPRKSGKLVKSIRVKSGKVKGKKNALAVRVTTNAGDNLFAGDEFYGGFIEFGWMKVPVIRVAGRFKSQPRGSGPKTKIPGRFFMRDAGRAAAAAAVDAFRKEVAERIRKHVQVKATA